MLLLEGTSWEYQAAAADGLRPPLSGNRPLCGIEKFERRVCPLYVARERWKEWRKGRNPVKDFST